MTKERIERAIEVINYAIDNQLSVYEASKKCGYASSYVKNIKFDVYDKYRNGVLDDDLFDYFQSAYEKYENNRELYIENDTNIEKNIPSGQKLYSTENDNEIVVGYSGDIIKTVPQLLKATEIDTSLWEVKSKFANAWTTTSFQIVGDKKIPVYGQNYQVKVRLEKIKEEKDGRSLAKVFKELVDEYTPPVISTDSLPQVTKFNNKDREINLLEVSLFDLHIGKLGWAGEVGENYDTKIAVSRFNEAIDNLLKRAKGFDISRVLFPIGNDFFNSDNLHNTTTNGTPQDEDLRWQKTFKMGCNLIVDGINKLKTLGVPVDVLVIPGNHDFERSFYMGTMIEAWFRNDEMVNVDNSASPRKYYKFGEVLLGFTHGNNEKESSLPMLMATEQKENWGKTTFHEFHLGHFHKKRNVKFTLLDKNQILNEDLGVIVRYLSSLTGTEEWHYKKGYVGNTKAGEAFIWNDKIGMVGHLNFNFTKFNKEH